MVCWAEGGAPANWLRPQRSTTETPSKTDTLGGTPRKRLTPTQTECGSGHKTEPSLALPETGEGDPRSGPASEGHVREEGPLSGWRPEGLALSNRRRPRGRDGGAPCTGGRAGDLSITESAGGNTYHTEAPRRDPAGAGRPRRGAGPGWREPIRRAAPGARAGSPRETQTHGSERPPKPRCSSAFRCDGRRTSPRPGLPHLCGLDPPSPR
uniref:Translation initiation factor IF-2-like n=1 Tax=Camelus bactrianus TaxID=9837 RepID=A0A9W3FNY1_CAMBA